MRNSLEEEVLELLHCKGNWTSVKDIVDGSIKKYGMYGTWWGRWRAHIRFRVWNVRPALLRLEKKERIESRESEARTFWLIGPRQKFYRC